MQSTRAAVDFGSVAKALRYGRDDAPAVGEQRRRYDQLHPKAALVGVRTRVRSCFFLRPRLFTPAAFITPFSVFFAALCCCLAGQLGCRLSSYGSPSPGKRESQRKIDDDEVRKGAQNAAVAAASCWCGGMSGLISKTTQISNPTMFLQCTHFGAQGSRPQSSFPRWQAVMYAHAFW